MFNLTRQIPLIGSDLAGLVLRPGEDFFLLPYLHHTVVLPLAVLFLLAQHRRRLLPGGDRGWPFLAVLAFIALVYPMPPDIPPHMEMQAPTGPWFFLGVQLLLRYGPAFWVGIVWPLLPMGLMAALPFVRPGWATVMRSVTAVVWALHAALLALGWWLVPRLGQ